ncbi:MAG TPA: phenylacetate--CoA ligase, partial [Paludibacteraceae bacterium]|nr:phenylacetate--CoA ligase [Paludibacteraceae bacterium]
MIWNEYIECSSRDAIIERQNKGLRKMVERLYFNVPFYRKKFQEMELSPYDIKGIEDLHKLPFTYKQDLRDNYPMGLFAVPQSEIVRLHASSGTTGKQTVVGYTRKDLDMWSEVVARCLSSAGVVHKDIVQIAYGYGLFTGGLGLHYGTEKIGASVIPISGGNTHRQLQTMQDLGSTVLACTPSYALYLAESLEKSGITKDQIKLRVGIFGAESWTDE